MTLTANDRAILRYDGKLWSAYVVLDRSFEAYTHYGATPVDALNNAMQAATILRELGTPNVVDIPTPAEFAAMNALEDVPPISLRDAMEAHHDDDRRHLEIR